MANNMQTLGFNVPGMTGTFTVADAEARAQLKNKLDATALPEAVNTALAQAKESGEFDGAPGDPGYTPVKGKDYFDGENGEDGVSPTVAVSSITGGHRIGITDKNGTKTVDVMDGEKGDAGRGITSVARTSGNGAAGTTDTYTITYTDGGKSTFTVNNGKDGSAGTNGQRGTGVLKVTTAPASYTTTTGGKNPIKRMAISTIKSQAHVNEVLVGDQIAYTYYHYHVYYLDATYAYMDTYQSIRGASGTAGDDGKDGTTYTPSVDASGNLSWTNNGGLSNPATVNIKGPKGDTPVRGKDYWTPEDIAAINAESQTYIDDKIADLEIGGTTPETVAETGVAVSLETDKGTQITVEGDMSAQVTLVHQGKNFCPSGLLNVPNYNNKGITVTANEDGTHTLTGTATSYVNYYLAHSSYGTTIYLPAGTYTKTIYIDGDVTDTQNNVSVNSMFEENGTAVNSTIPTAHAFSRVKTFTLNEPKYIRSMIYVPQGVTLDCVVSVQYELGDTSTPFEPYVKTTQNVTLPTTVSAMDGTNVFYTMTGETLTCSYTLSKEDTTLEEVKKLLKFDPTPYGLPILRLNGSTANMSKDDAVTLDYVYGELSGTCTCKWQGSSSVRYAKKNYTVKFDQAFEAKEGWGAQKKYCLKANFIDPSHARNLVAARLWGQIIASRSTADANLAACPNYGAVDGFPCIIMLNDEFHGLYTWNIPKDGWMLNFPTDGAMRECILCAEGVNASGGEAFKATENALDVGFSLEYITNENDTGWALNSLNNLISACIASDGTDLDTTLAAMIDWDSVIDYFCFSAALGNYDGIIKNYLLYTRDGTKWHMGAYDLDCLWGNWWDGSKFIGVNDGSYPAHLISKHRLLELAGRYKASKIKSRYKYLRQSVLREDLVSAEVANIIGGIPSVIFAEEHKTWPTLKMTSVDGHAQIVNWYRNRVAAVDALIEAMA